MTLTDEEIAEAQYHVMYSNAVRHGCQCEAAHYWMKKFFNLCKSNEEEQQRRLNASRGR